jgi:hypothetical protein
VRREVLVVGKFLAGALTTVVVLFWEGINGVLPVWLKRFSVTYYLKPLFPVELPIEGVLGLFTVVAEPTPPWLAVSGLLLFAGLALAFACWRIRRLEVLPTDAAPDRTSFPPCYTGPTRRDGRR